MRKIESGEWPGFVPANAAHRRQVAKRQPETGGYYCVDKRARLRWRVKESKSAISGNRYVLLAPCAGRGIVNFGPLIRLVLWP